MPKVTILFAALLILLGLVGYFGQPTGEGPSAADDEPAAATESAGADSAAADASKSKRSVTALIPAFAGAILLVFGVIGLAEGLRMHAMHGAVLIGLLGFLAAAGRSIPGLIKVASANSEVNTRSLFFVSMMAVLCGVYVGLCVRSFVAARRRRQAQEASADAAG